MVVEVNECTEALQSRGRGAAQQWRWWLYPWIYHASGTPAGPVSWGWDMMRKLKNREVDEQWTSRGPWLFRKHPWAGLASILVTATQHDQASQGLDRGQQHVCSNVLSAQAGSAKLSRPTLHQLPYLDALLFFSPLVFLLLC